MISPQKAKSIIMAKIPFAIEFTFIYKDCYVFSMPDPKSPYENPFYAVQISNGKAYCVSPTEDIEGFFEASERNRIEV